MCDGVYTLTYFSNQLCQTFFLPALQLSDKSGNNTSGAISTEWACINTCLNYKTLGYSFQAQYQVVFASAIELRYQNYHLEIIKQ